MPRVRNQDNVTISMLLSAYEQGCFPMADESGTIGFFAYEPRGIIPLDHRFRIRRSLRQRLNRNDYEIRIDQSPREVLQACSRATEVPKEEQWLSTKLMTLYLELFHIGIMHTIEVWKQGTEESYLAGGLYGLTFGAAFCGESMFSHEPYASQIALVALVNHLRHHGFVLLDTQMATEHLKQFGLIECTHDEYLKLFHDAATIGASFG